MIRYQAGDARAATALIDQLSPLLLSFFLLRTPSRADAEDLLQETWLSVHHARQSWRAHEPLLPWLYAIARHVRIDHFRRRARSARFEQAWEQPHAQAAARAEPPCSEELQALLAPLSESERELLELLKVAGFSLEDVARVTASSIGAVKQKVHRAYAKLRRAFGATSQPGGAPVGRVRD